MTTAPAGRVAIEEGVVVAKGGGRDLRADIFTPPDGMSNGAGVLLVHGGGWRNGDRKQLRGYGILLGRIGYTLLACEYRLSGEAQWPAQIHDVKAALRWMRANADRLNIDPSKIAVSGNSAGGHLSLMLGGTQNMPEFEGDGGNPGVSTEVAASVAFYAPAQLWGRENRRRTEAGERADVIGLLMAGKEHAEVPEARLREASPIEYAAKCPPTALFHGSKDELVPHEASVRMYRALDDAGVPAELHVYDGAPHAFDALPAFGRQCASIIELFLDRHVVRPRATTAAEVAQARR